MPHVDRNEIRDLLQRGLNAHQIAGYVGCSPPSVRAIVTREMPDMVPVMEANSPRKLKR